MRNDARINLTGAPASLCISLDPPLTAGRAVQIPTESVDPLLILQLTTNCDIYAIKLTQLQTLSLKFYEAT